MGGEACAQVCLASSRAYLLQPGGSTPDMRRSEPKTNFRQECRRARQLDMRESGSCTAADRGVQRGSERSTRPCQRYTGWSETCTRPCQQGTRPCQQDTVSCKLSTRRCQQDTAPCKLSTRPC